MRSFQHVISVPRSDPACRWDGLVTSDCILLSCKTSFIQASNASQDRSLYRHTNCSDWPLNSKRSTTMAVIGCIAQLRTTSCTLEEMRISSPVLSANTNTHGSVSQTCFAIILLQYHLPEGLSYAALAEPGLTSPVLT